MNTPKKPKVEHGTNDSVSILDDDLMWKILVHVDTKSLMRFKCVSKLFYSIIRNRDFAKEHSLHGGCYKGLLITDFAAYYPQFQPSRLNRVFYAYYHIAANCSTCRWLMYYYHFSLDLRKFTGVTAIVKGLTGFYNDVCFTLCNVSTREMVELPRNDEAEFYNYHLGFDPVKEVYKVLKVYALDENWTSFDTRIFTVGVGSDLIWRSIDPAPAFCETQSVCIGGTLYWMPCEDSFMRSSLIAFNLNSESFDTIPLPGNSTFKDHLVEISGSPALFSICGMNMKIWMMQNGERGGLGAWVVRTFDLRMPLEGLIWAGTLPTGEMLMSQWPVRRCPSTIFKYDHIKNEMTSFVLTGYCKSRSQERGVDPGEMQIRYYEENIIPLAPMLNMQQQ